MAYLPKWEASTTVSNRRLVGSKGSWKSGWKVPTLGFNHYTYDNVWYGVVLRHSWLRRYELQPKFTAMESSIRGVSIFWKLSWGLENDNTLFKNDNVCLCWSWSSVILCLTAQVIQCISYERSKRQNLFFINRCVVMVCVWQPFWFWHLLIFHVSSSNASSFPQDNTTTFQTKGFPIDFSRIIALFVYAFLDPTRCSKR